jgi:hypothetical protein
MSALILAFAFIHVRDSHYATTDILVTFLFVASIYGSVRYLSNARWIWLFLAGLTAGAAIGLKYLPAPVLVTPTLAIAYHARTGILPESRWIAAKHFALLGVSSGLGFLLAFPAPLFNVDLFRFHLSQALGQAATPLGGFVVGQVPAWEYYLWTLSWGMGPPVVVASLVGCFLALRQRRAQMIVIVTAAVGYYGAISVVNTYFARYALPLVPLLAVLAATGVVFAEKEMRRALPVLWKPQLVVPVVLLLILYPAVASVRHDYLLTQVDTRTLAKEWIDRQLPAGSHIVTQWFGPPLSTIDDPLLGSPQVFETTEISPFTTNPDRYSLSTYAVGGAHYILINSYNYNLRRVDEAENEMRQQFYNSLEQETTLIATFSPTEGDAQPSFMWEQLYGPAVDLFQVQRPGPTIKLYKIR